MQTRPAIAAPPSLPVRTIAPRRASRRPRSSRGQASPGRRLGACAAKPPRSPAKVCTPPRGGGRPRRASGMVAGDVGERQHELHQLHLARDAVAGEGLLDTNGLDLGRVEDRTGGCRPGPPFRRQFMKNLQYFHFSFRAELDSDRSVVWCKRGKGHPEPLPRDPKKVPQNRRERCARRPARAGAERAPARTHTRTRDRPPRPEGDEMTAADPRRSAPP